MERGSSGWDRECMRSSALRTPSQERKRPGAPFAARVFILPFSKGGLQSTYILIRESGDIEVISKRKTINALFPRGMAFRYSKKDSQCLSVLPNFGAGFRLHLSGTPVNLSGPVCPHQSGGLVGP